MGFVSQFNITVCMRIMQKIAFITTCSARKKSGLAPPVSIKGLTPGSQEDLLRRWKELIESSTHRKPVWDIYSGRAIFEMKKLSQEHEASLSIISAGLGLIDSFERKPLYDLTVSSGRASSIACKITAGEFSLKAWWAGVNKDAPSPITSYIQNARDTFVVIVLSSRYFELVRSDLETISPKALKRVRIVGIKPQSDSPVNPAILPYDDRLNGSDSPVPGTLSDFPQRCAMHFMQNIYNGGSLKEDRERVAQCMESLSWPVRTTGIKMGDEQLISIIADAIKETGLPKSKLLKYFRHTLKIACEQKRFACLYDKAVKGIVDGKKN